MIYEAQGYGIKAARKVVKGDVIEWEDSRWVAAADAKRINREFVDLEVSQENGPNYVFRINAKAVVIMVLNEGKDEAENDS